MSRISYMNFPTRYLPTLPAYTRSYLRHRSMQPAASRGGRASPPRREKPCAEEVCEPVPGTSYDA